MLWGSIYGTCIDMTTHCTANVTHAHTARTERARWCCVRVPTEALAPVEQNLLQGNCAEQQDALYVSITTRTLGPDDVVDVRWVAVFCSQLV